MKKIIIRTSGGGLVVYIFLITFFIFLSCLSVYEIFYKGQMLYQLIILIITPFFIAYCVRIIKNQKIELNQIKLKVNFISQLDNDWSPKIHRESILISDIDSVNIARIKYFEENVNKFNNQKLFDLIAEYRNKKMPFRGRFYSMRLASGYTPIIYISAKDNTKNSFAFSTKPFSKKTLRILIVELKKLNVPVFIQQDLKI